ncbi:DedD protein [Idiomarina fontislapidosi]|uniref:SPOR domain-containing protein n=1 Tax=Idiomarina fontislapidosi TaxID=263723 RepID=A0A432YBA3_9GAMM|nr:SPOR domain-containing protein [Idiomarina fontislapidosi]PYE35273.1 DedD protein [Idiomarina fontislapidosi]RUO58162.1 SPOR domain-containing protein [Idiomarina fontislapidosi]
MASRLQNRIVGSLILVALAVIILPDVLDGKKTEAVEDFETIPLKPAQTSTLQEPTEFEPQPVNTRAAADDQVTSDNAPTVDAQKQVEAPKRDIKSVTVSGDAYVIQLGAFSNRDSVLALQKQLQAKGFAVFIESGGSQGQLTKLMVGPDASKQALEQQLDALKDLTGLQGKVLSYQP